MSILAACILLVSSGLTGRHCTSQRPLAGLGSRYDPGLMEATVALRQSYWPGRRGLPPDTSAWDGFVAALSCDDIGLTYLIRVYPSKRWRPYLVADCAGSVESYLWMRDNKVLVEFGYQAACKLGILGRSPSQVQVEVIVLSREQWPPPGRGPALYRRYNPL